LERGVNCK